MGLDGGFLPCFSLELRISPLITSKQDFFRMDDLVKSPISYTGKRNDPAGSELSPDNGSACTNLKPFYSKARIQQSLTQHQGTILPLLNRNKECQSLRIWSSSNCSRMGPFNNVLIVP